MTLMYSDQELNVMQGIKEVFDPQGIMNPGKQLPRDIPVPDLLPEPKPAPASTFAPATAQEAAEALRSWAVAGLHVRIRGGGTKSSLLHPADATLSTAGLAGIIKCSPEDLFVTVAAGTPLAELQAELAQHKMWVPLAAPWPTATVGGIVATNFNAPLRMRYGGIRDLTLSATVAMPNGWVIRAGRPVVKNVAGYDLPKLFIGSHGTLGVLTDVSLKLAPLPRARATLIVPVETLAQGLKWGGALLRVALVASSLLLCHGCDLPGVKSAYALIYTAEGVSEDVAAELAQARSALQAAGAAGLTQLDAPSGSEVWAAHLAAIPAGTTLTRAAVPVKDLAGLMFEVAPLLGDRPFLADLANGMLYAQDVENVALLRKPAVAAGGHAVLLAGPTGGADVWGHTPDGLDLMRQIKARWDPAGICNPGAFVV